MLVPTFGCRVVPTRPGGPLAFLTLSVLLTVMLSSAVIPSEIVRPSLPLPAAPARNQVPLSFVPNMGQADPAVRFQAQVPGGSLFFTAAEVVLALATPSETASDPAMPVIPSTTAHGAAPAPILPTTVQLQFVGASPQTHLMGTKRLPGVVNDLRGNDPARWRTEIPTYGGLSYRQLYPGIDLHYANQGGHLKGTYVVAPGADSTRIRWRYAGAQRVAINDQTGALEITLPGDTVPSIYEVAPIAWQERAEQRVPIAVRFHVAANGHVGFAVGAYDRNLPLILDPVLYSTYLGGSSSDWGFGIAVDPTGNTYISGMTFSADFPTRNAFDGTFSGGTPSTGGGDAFVSKLDARGSSLIYSTYLGGSAWDASRGITVDSAGNAYLTGGTQSADFPTRGAVDASYNGGDSDAFVTSLDPRGMLRWSTFLGGSATEAGAAITVDPTGGVYITGRTWSSNFPTAQAFDASYNGGSGPFEGDAFVSALDAAGSALRYSTYLGGSNIDQGMDVAVDRAGNAYVTGMTQSRDFPMADALDATMNNEDAFVSSFDARGQTLRYSTYLGGTAFDMGNGIAVDAAGNAYLTGHTQSNTFPTVNALDASFGGGQTDAFVSTLSAAGAALRWSTFLGGSGDDIGLDIAVDTVGNAAVTGWTQSYDFPMAQPIDSSHGSGWDGFVSSFDAPGTTLRLSTFLGGSFYEECCAVGDDGGEGIAVDTSGATYVVGWTQSTDFPTANPLDASVSGTDAFVTKLSAPAPPQTLYALSSTNELLSFASDEPGRILTRRAVNGLQQGEKLIGIEVRPATGRLYAIGTSSRLYRIEAASGQATAVGSQPFTPQLQGHVFGLDVNAAADELHVVSDTGQHLRLDLAAGTVRGVEPALRYVRSDTNAGHPTGIDGAAWTPGAHPSLYIVDTANDVVAVVRNGTLQTVGAVGMEIEPLVGFDIASTGVGYAALRAKDGISGAILVTIDPGTGRTVAVGRIGSGEDVRGLAILVEP